MFSNIRFRKGDKLVVLTGAGISAESGVKTFRDSNGLWEEHAVEDVATPQGFARDPYLVWDFYTARYQQLQTVLPNKGHLALKKIEDYLRDDFVLITQNIDGLHRKAGSDNVLEMHGAISDSYCNKCGERVSTEEVLAKKVSSTKDCWFKCSVCSGYFRPDIVWFGEVPHFMEKIMKKIQLCDIFLVVGTSGLVYPAAQFLILAKQNGAKTIGINLEAPENVGFIDEFHQGKAGEILPRLVETWFK